MIRSSYCCEFKSAATNEILDAIYEGFEIDIISTDRFSPIYRVKYCELGQFWDAREYTAHSNALRLYSVVLSAANDS